MNVLVLNSGSSSLKFQLIATDTARLLQNTEIRLCRGQIEGIGGQAVIAIQTSRGQRERFTASLSDVSEALEYAVRWIASDASGISEVRDLVDIDAIGHRVVHGGELFTESTLITHEVQKGIEECIDLAPRHNTNNLKGILAAQVLLGARTPQVAVFDTSFHQSIPEHAYLYAVPYHLYQRHHIRRYGFHGTSHRYVMERYGDIRALPREQIYIITIHLGNGCSAAAIYGGYSVDTSMGMTPLEGLVMGTRSGDIDPALVNLIAMKENLSSYDVEVLLNTQSGLLGVSGLTNDMRVLLGELGGLNDHRVRLAIEIFCHRARKCIGAFLASMGGADAIVFTGGIGENSSEIRSRICDGFEWAGLTLDDNRNRRMVGLEGQISTDDSMLHAFVIPTDEELLIARDTVDCIENSRHLLEMEQQQRSKRARG